MKSVLLSTLFLPISLFAGVINGGGGSSVVCYDSKGAITSAELLDLFESRVLHQIQPQASAENYDVIASEMILQMQQIWSTNGKSDSYGLKIAPQVTKILNKMVFLPEGVGLNSIADSNPVVTPPKECKIVQTAAYLNSLDLYVDPVIWRALDNNNKAALIAHEWIYYILRRWNGERTSDRVRRVVPLLLTKSPLLGIWDGLTYNIDMDGDKLEHCIAYSKEQDEIGQKEFPFAEFNIYKNKSGNIIHQFKDFNFGFVLTKTSFNTMNQVTGWPMGLNSGKYPIDGQVSSKTEGMFYYDGLLVSDGSGKSSGVFDVFDNNQRARYLLECRTQTDPLMMRY